MVRVWNLPFCLLDRQRLLGQHLELHILYNAEYRRQQGVKAGWQSHPQAKRFRDKLGQLITLHDRIVEEMTIRGYNHRSPLPFNKTVKTMPFSYTWDAFLNDLQDLTSRGGLRDEPQVLNPYLATSKNR